MNILPDPSPLKPQAGVQHLKTRLDWGEPALTILDVRERDLFNAKHILGAISMPLKELVAQASDSLEPTRDLYVYGETDEQSAEAAAQLRDAGFHNVAELRGGLPAWQAFNYPVEGYETTC
ncbi:MAG TPA: rhodanese-like domain-containing protein [Candidatus Caenarcaniphilales bacterium]|jgi:rhodanese-related sulfurtransferase